MFSRTYSSTKKDEKHANLKKVIVTILAIDTEKKYSQVSNNSSTFAFILFPETFFLLKKLHIFPFLKKVTTYHGFHRIPLKNMRCFLEVARPDLSFFDQLEPEFLRFTKARTDP